MRITVLCPTHRGPTELLSVTRMFRNQRHQDRRLVFIENGPALGVSRSLGIVADAVMQSDHSKVSALNVGLAWLRTHGGGAWALWDDDDYYGPEYLTGVAVVLPKYNLIGKRSLYVRRNDGRLWLIERSAGWPLGHSFAGWSDCCDFRECNRWGEDDFFVQDMLDHGAQIGDSGATSFVWQRSGDLSKHIWPATDDQIAQILTLKSANSKIIDYGNANRILVDCVEKQSGRVVELPDFDPLNVPGIPIEFQEKIKQLRVNNG